MQCKWINLFCHQIIPDLPFIHPSEVAIINKVVRLGSHYRVLDDFITGQLHAVINLTAPPTNETNQGIK